MKWTFDDIINVLELAEVGECDKDCKNCPIFLPQRDECYTIAERKWKVWAKKKHMEFQEYLKEYKG